MKQDRKIFIGFDSTQPEPYYVCRQSLVNQGVDPTIIQPIVLDLLEKAGWYWRKDAASCSTEFTNSRFLVPFLSGFYGQSIFCDADFLWCKNPEVLFDMFEDDHEQAVRVVKHNITREQLTEVKMDGKVQTWYPRKNWSSMMLFNNSHPDCMKLTPTNVSEMSMSWLHQLQWTSDNVGRLPKTFNYLVGYGYGKEVRDPYAVHFTDGGPWLPAYRDVEYSKEWFNVQQKTQRPVY